MVKPIKYLFTVMITASMLSTTAFAGQWIKEGKCWRYNNGDGTYPTSTWKWIDGDNDGMAECYYFDEDGFLVTNDDIPHCGYTINENGARVSWDSKEVISVHVDTDTIDTISGKYVCTYAYGLSGKGGSFIPDEGVMYAYLHKNDESNLTVTIYNMTEKLFRCGENSYDTPGGDGLFIEIEPDGTVVVTAGLDTYYYTKYD
ncbi:hypothetical protein [Oribacterium sp. P6A1]|uniref:hypothetical protein n=1 Tax=Oribacterium sp. P6A1 TaxID=1410612 RepID=UPI00068FF0E5|nr:hypothetical protein [Oribacterium sp. P6A1]